MIQISWQSGLGAVLGSVAMLAFATSGLAQDAPKPQVVVTHLDNPCGVGVHGASGHVFVAAHKGVYRYVPGKPGKVYLEVEGFPTDVYGKGPKYDIGPLGVAFWGDDRLVVGDGSRPDGEELLYVFKVGKEPPQKPGKEGDAEHKLGPIKEEGDLKPEGNFYSVVVTDKAIIVSSNGDDTKGWCLRSEIKDGKPGELKRWLATKEQVNVDAPVPITLNKEGQLVIGQMGEVNVAGDSLLTIYDQEGKLLKKYETGLSDLAGLAYSPKTGKLYGTDFSWVDKEKGGLFRLDIDGDKVKATKILGLDRPTAISFDKDGALYIAVFGTDLVKAEEGKPTGALLRLDAGL